MFAITARADSGAVAERMTSRLVFSSPSVGGCVRAIAHWVWNAAALSSIRKDRLRGRRGRANERGCVGSAPLLSGPARLRREIMRPHLVPLTLLGAAGGSLFRFNADVVGATARRRTISW